MTSLTKVDFNEALANSSDRIRRAFEASHAALVKLGIPHVVVGGLAVNAHGHHYSTKDIDYLVDTRDAFEIGDVVSFKTGVPFQVGGVAIDYVPEDAGYPAMVRQEMQAEIEAARALPDKIGIVADWLLVWMKLNVGRSKDVAGVEGMIQAGLDVDSVREALTAVGDARVLESFDRCVARAV